jgi:hypothetical protein
MCWRSMRTQKRMKSANGGARRFGPSGGRLEPRAEKLVDARLHFARGFIGKSDGENIIRRHAVGDQMGNAAGNDTRLPGARPRQNQDGAGNSFDSLALGRIEQG